MKVDVSMEVIQKQLDIICHNYNRCNDIGMDVFQMALNVVEMNVGNYSNLGVHYKKRLDRHYNYAII